MALLLLDNKNNNNDYENNRSSPIPQKEGSNDDNGNLLAKLFLVDDDPDIVQVLKLGLPKNRLCQCIYQSRTGITKLQIQCKALLFGAIRYPNASAVWNTTSKKTRKD